MDLSNVVFIENTGRKTKTKANKKNENKSNFKTTTKANKKKKGDNNKNERINKAPVKVKANRKVVKHGKPQRSTKNNDIDGRGHHWVKVPPKGREPRTEKHNGKTYHWCHHCKFWALHRPGKGKRCQAVDPLGHLLNYFGGNTTTTNTYPKAAPQTQIDWGAISMDISL